MDSKNVMQYLRTTSNCITIWNCLDFPCTYFT